MRGHTHIKKGFEKNNHLITIKMDGLFCKINVFFIKKVGLKRVLPFKEYDSVGAQILIDI